MRFKQWLFKEWKGGLGDLGANMDRVFDTPAFGNFAGAYLSSDQSGSEQPDTLGMQGHPLFLPSVDLTIPNIQRSGRIRVLQTNRTPMYVELSDGTKAYFTYDEWRRIQGTPEIGKVMTIIFQRHPEDHGEPPSKIEKAIVT